MSEIGAMLRNLRKGRDLSQEGLAEALEVDERRGCAAMLRPRHEVILMRGITLVEVTPLNALMIATADGRQRTYRILGARELQDAILAHLA